MKRLYFLSVTALIAGLVSFLTLDAQAGPKKIINSGNATAKGGNGGNATGAGSKAGNGGSAIAQAGSIGAKKGGPITNSGNATATGGNGGNASGAGSQGGNGGGAVAVSGNGNTVLNGNGNTIINKTTNNNISFSPGGGGFGGGFVTGGAFAAGGFGGDGVIAGSPGSAIAVSPGEIVVGPDAVAKGQDGKDDAEPAEREEVFTRRFLKVKNDSDVPMKVFVQYRGMSDKKWVWAPADPS